MKRDEAIKGISYDEILRKRLANPKTAAEYLNACYEEGPDVFLIGLRDVVQAQGGVGKAAKASKLNRESLYRLFSKNGNPRLSSLNSALGALGLKIIIAPA
jgi:probable addiction module antidote protein